MDDAYGFRWHGRACSYCRATLDLRPTVQRDGFTLTSSARSVGLRLGPGHSRHISARSTTTQEFETEMNRNLQAVFADDIGVIALSPTEWRVSDLTIDEADAVGLIGYVQKIGDVYEITALGKPYTRVYVGSFDAAIDALSTERAA